MFSSHSHHQIQNSVPQSNTKKSGGLRSAASGLTIKLFLCEKCGYCMHNLGHQFVSLCFRFLDCICRCIVTAYLYHHFITVILFTYLLLLCTHSLYVCILIATLLCWPGTQSHKFRKFYLFLLALYIYAAF